MEVAIFTVGGALLGWALESLRHLRRSRRQERARRERLASLTQRPPRADD
jgi:hypothetical protein